MERLRFTEQHRHQEEERENGDLHNNEDQDQIEEHPPIRSREEFVDSIRQWVILDKQMQVVNEKSREIRGKRTAMGDRLCEFMEDQNIADKPIKVKNEGEIHCIERKKYSPLTFSYIEERLAEIIEDDDQVDYIMNYLRERREISIHLELNFHRSR